MFRAEQQVLNQETNQGLVAIRKSEINYYVKVNSAMGTQAALLAGFTYGIFTQNTVNSTAPYVNSVLAAYYVAVAVTIASALHVIINAMLLQVLGPGLALNGPIGSMARSTEGMHIEQGQVIWSFSIMIAFFAISTVLTFWCVMDFWPAVASTIVFIAVVRVSLTYSKRLWLRFYWNENKNTMADWSERGGDEDDEPTIAGKISTLELRSVTTGNSYIIQTGNAPTPPPRRPNNAQSPTQNYSKNSGRFSIFNWLKPSEREIRESLSVADRFAAEARSGLTTLQPKDVAMEGYMTKRGVSRTGISGKLVKEPWERRYFVINGRGQMYYYRNHQDYRSDPVEKRVRARPIEFEDYYATALGGGGGEVPPFTVGDTATVTTAATTSGGAVPKFQLTLTPREQERSYRQWHLRCDTEEVLAEWVRAIRKISPSSFTAVAAAPDGF